MIEKFIAYTQYAQKILITSHISPDPDAMGSALALGRALRENYPNKDIKVVLEERPNNDLSFLTDYEIIEFNKLVNVVEDLQPQLLIILDANNYARISRNDSQQLKALVTKKHIKTIVIDHHEADDDKFDLIINNKRPATAEEVYVLCYDQLGYKKPVDYAEAILLGIISDTQRHKFDHPGYKETFRVMTHLFDDGASTEKLEMKLEHHTKGELAVIAELAVNITADPAGYNYTYISDEFISDEFMCRAKTISANDIKLGCDEFVNRYIRTFEDNRWGFIVYPDLAGGDSTFGVTMRAVSGGQDVSKIARVLGGGGHKPAAGAKVKAKSVVEVVNQVRRAIKEVS